jgi:hypothetical protein
MDGEGEKCGIPKRLRNGSLKSGNVSIFLDTVFLFL